MARRLAGDMFPTYRIISKWRANPKPRMYQLGGLGLVRILGLRFPAVAKRFASDNNHQAANKKPFLD